MHNSSNKKLKQQKGKPKMDGLAQPGASKGISKRSHLQNSSTSWIGGGIREPSDPSIRESGGPGTRGPGGLSTHWPGGGSSREPSGPCIRQPGGPITREHSDPSIREAGGPGTRGSGSLTTRWPGVASTREPGGIISNRPGGSCIREPGGPSTRGPNGNFKRSDLQKSFTRSDPPNHQQIQKRHTKYNWLENEENRNSFSCQSPVTVINQGEEDEQEDTHEINYAETETDTSDDEHEENIGSTSHGVTITRKESRALGETRKSRSKKKNLVFEVDECSGKIVGEDAQHFITKGGCVMRKFAKLDGTTWKKQPDDLKRDIVTKCVENSNYDETCGMMEYAMQKQLASQHKNKQYKLHLHFRKFPSKEEAMMHPPDGVQTSDWVNLCERFASEAFQEISARNKKNRSFNEIPPAVGTHSTARRVDAKKRKGVHVTAIEHFEIAHYCEKKEKMVNEKAEKTLNELRIEEANSTLTPAEICLKQLKHIPGHIKGRSASTRNFLGNEKLRSDLESEKERSKALEEDMKVMNKRQRRLQKQNKKFKGQLKFMMEEITRLSRLHAQTNDLQD